MEKPSKYFKQGIIDCKGYYNDPGFAGLVRGIRPEDAIKLFFPPAEEAMMMISRPLDKDRVDWIAGWKQQFNDMLIKLSGED